MGKLHDQMKRDLELRNFSPHTRRTYLACVRRFALYFHYRPAVVLLERILFDWVLLGIGNCNKGPRKGTNSLVLFI